MQASVTVPMAAPADKIWNIVANVRNTGKFSPEVIEAEWLDGATGPALGGQLRKSRNIRDMRKTLERIKAVVEAPSEGAE
jgi:hypothetical protein